MTNTEILISPYASLSRRFVALLFDVLILAIPSAIGGHIIPVIGSIAVWFFYAPLLESSELRATLGKWLMGIQVTDSLGKRISLRASIIRNLLKCVSSLLLFIGFFFAFFSRKKQTLHDMLAETFVLYGRSEIPIGDAWVSAIKDLFQIQSSDSSSDSSTISNLERLQKLRESGALTEEEFQKQKAEILK